MFKFPLTTMAFLLAPTTAVAQMVGGQDGHMVGNERGWGMGWGMGWGFGTTALIVLISVILGAAYLKKTKQK